MSLIKTNCDLQRTALGWAAFASEVTRCAAAGEDMKLFVSSDQLTVTWSYSVEHKKRKSALLAVYILGFIVLCYTASFTTAGWLTVLLQQETNSEAGEENMLVQAKDGAYLLYCLI